MRFHKPFWALATCMLACTTPAKQTKTPFNSAILKSYTNSDSGIILSCFNCSCIIDFLKTYYATHTMPDLLMDTTCSTFRVSNSIHYSHLPQKILDTLYERNYNAILFKNLSSKEGFTFKVLKTEENKGFEKIVKRFFEN